MIYYSGLFLQIFCKAYFFWFSSSIIHLHIIHKCHKNVFNIYYVTFPYLFNVNLLA
jgi:hypothetical protein